MDYLSARRGLFSLFSPPAFPGAAPPALMGECRASIGVPSAAERLIQEAMTQGDRDGLKTCNGGRKGRRKLSLDLSTFQFDA